VKRVATAIALAILVSSQVVAQEPATIVVEDLPCSLAGTWLFRTGHDPAWASPFRERRYWQSIEVPGPWERQGFASYNGHAWYRLSFFLPSRFAGETLGLDLGTVGDIDEVFLNGRPVGATGSPPPEFEKATLARRFYLIPKDAPRFGEHNELSVHVYNKTRFGGFLGPAPRLDRWDHVLLTQVLRDIATWVLAAVLGTLALLQLIVFSSQRHDLEHLTFALFLLAIALYYLTYATWGPVRLVGHSTNFRLNVACLLAAVALFLPPIYALARQGLPIAVMGSQSLLALGVAFTVVWRDESDLYFWVYVAELVAVLFAVVALRAIALHLWSGAWGRALFGTSLAFLLLVTLDILVHSGLVPRIAVFFGEMYSPLAIIPLAAVLSVALVSRWAEHRWGEPTDLATGLSTFERFTATLGREMDRSRRSFAPLTVALLRITGDAPITTGDTIGSLAAKVLRRSLRQVDLVARRGDDTFAILLADTDERAAMATLDRLRRAIAETLGASHHPTTVAGVAQYRPSRHTAPAELLAEAEGALYAAMNEGGNATATAP